MSDARKGKIARLPAEIRLEVNRRLRNGEGGPKILRWLNALPQTKAVMQEDFKGSAVEPQNLSEWRKGGYVDWLKQQERVDQTKELARFCVEMAQAAGGSLAEGGSAVAAGEMLKLLETSSEEELENRIKALAVLRRNDIAQQRVRIAEKRLLQSDRLLALEEARFQRQTAELFLRWHEDKRAQEIAEGRGKKDVKIEQLRALMFGPVEPAPAAAGA